MKGILLTSLTDDLHPVAAKHNAKPVHAIQNVSAKFGHWTQYIEQEFDTFSIENDAHRLPFAAFKGFSFDETCKIKYSSIFIMDETVKEMFENTPPYSIVEKIRSSMWRWGIGNDVWNEVVSAYDCIRRFTFLERSDFEIRLDHTIGFNPYGRATYHRDIYLDGVFAFFVYYKGEHVLTIRFSIMKDKRLLIQQVQSAKRSGNTFLFRLPKNRLEFIIECFCSSFVGYRLYLIDGTSLVKKTLADYGQGLQSAKGCCERYRRFIARGGESKTDYERYLADSERDCAEFEAKISHLKADVPRLIAMYRDTGKFKLGNSASDKVEPNNILHYRILC